MKNFTISFHCSVQKIDDKSLRLKVSIRQLISSGQLLNLHRGLIVENHQAVAAEVAFQLRIAKHRLIGDVVVIKRANEAYVTGYARGR